MPVLFRSGRSSLALASLALLAPALSVACAERRANSGSSPVQVAEPAGALSGSAPSPSASVETSRSLAAAPAAPSAGASPAGLAAPFAAPAGAASASRGSTSASAAPSAAPEASSGGTATSPLLDSDGKALPQTEERPRVDSAAFQQRLELLVDAIAHDQPQRAISVFFPVVAYEQVKAVEKPARDWQYRLIRAFENDVHEYHRALGRDAEQARFAGIDVPESSARWMKPGSEGNRLGYFRVLRSHLRVKKADGKERVFEVTSMISWRGEWYVVHLNGFD